MPWHPDVPDIPLKKPHILELIESMSSDELNSMDPSEVDQKIREIALALAKEYQKEKGGSYAECFPIISMALSTTGGAIGGKFGAFMVGTCDQQAQYACSLVYPDPNQKF